MTALGLTRRQRDLLLIIQELSAEGIAPTYGELARETGITSRGGVYRLLHQLADRGAIALSPRRARSLRVLTPLPMPEEPEIVGFFEDPERLAELGR